VIGSGTVIEPVPVAGLEPNFSPMPRIAPPPFGSDSAGAAKDFDAPSSDFLPLAINGLRSGLLLKGVTPKEKSLPRGRDG